jgi:Short-chain dehydrogenases of various substrate specificities
MKVVIITGASSGIGLAAAKEFAANGYCVVLAARNINKLNSVVSDLNNIYGAECEIGGKKVPRFLAIATDVVKEEDCKNLIETAYNNYGQIDVLVNNAGISMRAMFKDLDLSVIKT